MIHFVALRHFVTTAGAHQGPVESLPLNANDVLARRKTSRGTNFRGSNLASSRGPSRCAHSPINSIFSHANSRFVPKVERYESKKARLFRTSLMRVLNSQEDSSQWQKQGRSVNEDEKCW
jgi:hypothetical protein